MARKKRRKYKSIEISLSDRQNKSLVNYCHARQITPVKLIKRLLKNYTSGFEKEVPPNYYVTDRQLNLFDSEKNAV